MTQDTVIQWGTRGMTSPSVTTRRYDTSIDKPFIKPLQICRSSLQSWILRTNTLYRAPTPPANQSRAQQQLATALVCIESALATYEQFVGKGPLKYLPLYKTSQDHLKRYNNNPSCREFTASLRRILLHKELEESDSGNALILNRSLIFSINKKNENETDEINFSTPSWRSLEDEDRATSNNNDLLDDENIVNILGATTEIGRDIVEYVAGYVARSLRSKIWPGSECNSDATSAAAVLNYAYLQPAFLSRV
ncbi:hypothetical protein J6590_022875 [Homalodisca vitripennis]|nr:hypothetical protein J6590_022875 [Homalodisca vitripennis]